MKYLEQLIEIIQEIENAKDIEDSWYLLCHLCITYDKKISDVPEKLTDKEFDCSLLILQAVFENNVFNEYLNDSLEQEKLKVEDSSDIVGKRKYIKMLLQVSFFGFGFRLAELSYEQVQILRKTLSSCFKNKQKYVHNEFTLEKIHVHLVDVCRNADYNYNDVFPFERLGVDNIYANLLFRVSIKAAYIVQVSIISLSYFKYISTTLKKENGHVANRLSNLYGASSFCDGKISQVLKLYSEKYTIKDALEKYVENYRSVNEKVVSNIIHDVAKDFQFDEDIHFDLKLDEKLKDTRNIMDKIVIYSEDNLSAYKRKDSNSANEWANKVYIITIELLSVLLHIINAKDIGWRRNVAVRAYSKWLNEINQIINRDELLDDWDLIKTYLTEEDDTVEWKTSFFTSVEDEYIDKKVDAEKKKQLLGVIVKTIIGMMNTQGGTIIVGLCENPEKITRESVLAKCIIRNGISFYDVNHELEVNNINYDGLVRQIQDRLKLETQLSITKLDAYWKLTPVEIVSDTFISRIIIYKIDVQKSESLVFHVSEEKEVKRISLVKRVNKRTIHVDPREQLTCIK